MESSGFGDGPLSVDASGDRQAPLVGRLLDDRYRLDSQIARGGMATVFVATDTRLDRQVAVKVMHRALADDPEFVARFTREAKASARLSAAEVVAVHDYGTDPSTGLAYLVMEHIRGINLRQLLLERGALTPARTVALMEPVLRALAAAHAAGLVHRDIKPENVLLADDGRVKVADFGLARAVEASNLTQTTGLLMGTVAYLAPEQVETGLADARSDVYAAGVVMWELLTGTPPYSADSPLAVAYKHVHEDIPAPSTAMSGIPPALDALVLRATRRAPGDRPANGEAFLNELRASATGLPSVAEAAPTQHQTVAIPRPPAGTPDKPPRTKKRRRPWLVPTAAFLALALIALGGGWYLGTGRFTKAPGVTGKTFAEASAILASEGLDAKRGVAEFSEFVGTGLVLKQSPDLGGKIRKGGTVTLVLSKGKDRRVVPSLAGQSEQAARAALIKLGLTVAPSVEREFHKTIPADAVTRTKPKVGEKLKPGTAVTLIVSKGPAPVAVPNVVGKTRMDARVTLQRLGFVVAVVEAFSDAVAKDKVISQSPEGGRAAQGSTVRLTVSKGPDVVVVPEVRGKSRDEAVRILQQAGLVPVVQEFPGGPDKVLRTDPGGGRTVKRGATVNVFVF